MSDRDTQGIWNALTEEQRIASTCVVLAAALGHAREGGSFRDLIYERLGLSTAAYVPIYDAGGMDFSNEVVAMDDSSAAAGAVAEALKLIEAHALAQPMQASGIKRDDGSDVQMPTPERTAWFGALWAIQRKVSEASAQGEVIRRQRAEIARKGASDD